MDSMELRVWIGTVQRVIAGVSPTTTSEQVIIALAQATGKTGRFSLFEKWRNYERPLAPHDCPLHVIQRYGDSAPQVKFILRRTGEVSGAQRRLAEAKSPKPQKRRSAIKKSMSFSGTVSPSFSPKPFQTKDPIAEDDCHSDQANSESSRKSDPPSDSALNPPHSLTSWSESSRLSPPPFQHYYPDVHEGAQATELDYSKARGSNSVSSISSTDQLQSRLTEDVRTKRPKARDRSVERRDHRSKTETRHRERKEENVAREYAELQQSIAAYERRLEDETKKLHNLEQDISSITTEEEAKWVQLYKLRENVGEAALKLEDLENMLDDYDDVLLSEELNVLLRRRHEINKEMTDMQNEIERHDGLLVETKEASRQLTVDIEEVSKETDELQESIDTSIEEISQIQKQVDSKDRFLEEAEKGYLSACEDHKEAELILKKRRQMIVELERELREFNLKNFISTGFSEKYVNSAAETLTIPNNSNSNTNNGLLI